MVAVQPLLIPANPSCLIMFFVTCHVPGASFALENISRLVTKTRSIKPLPPYLDLLACSETFTTSNGLTKIASNTPAVKPAIEKVWKGEKLNIYTG